MFKDPNPFNSKLKAKISRWDFQDDQSRARASKFKEGDLLQHQIQVGKFWAKGPEFVGKRVAAHKTREAAWEDLKTGYDIVRQAMLESIEAAQACSRRLATSPVKKTQNATQR